MIKCFCDKCLKEIYEDTSAFILTVEEPYMNFFDCNLPKKIHLCKYCADKLDTWLRRIDNE